MSQTNWKTLIILIGLGIGITACQPEVVFIVDEDEIADRVEKTIDAFFEELTPEASEEEEDVQESEAFEPPDNGNIIYSSGGQFLIIDPQGELQGTVSGLPSGAFNPVWSPDGNTIAFIRITTGAANVYTINVDGSSLTQLTDFSYNISRASWSPDGEYLAVTFNNGEDDGLYVMRSDGTCLTRLYVSDTYLGEADWSPSGDVIAVMEGMDITLFNIETGDTQVLTDSNRRIIQSGVAWSPDGQSITYLSEVTGDPELFIIDVATGEQVQLTNSPGWDQSPDWSTDGRFIVFASTRDGDLKIYKLSVSTLKTTQLSEEYGANPSWWHQSLPNFSVPEIPCN